MDDLSFLTSDTQPDPATLDLAVEAGGRAAEALHAAQAASLDAPWTRPERFAWAATAAAALADAAAAIEHARQVAARVPPEALKEVYSEGYLDRLAVDLDEARQVARLQAAKAFHCS